MTFIELDWVKIEEEKLRQIIKEHPELVSKPSEGRYYFPKNLDWAFYIRNKGGVTSSDVWRQNRVDQEIIGMWVFQTEEQAEREIEKQKAKVRIWKYVQENWLYREPDWNNDDQFKHYIVYLHSEKYLGFDHCCSVQPQTELPFFKSREDAVKVVKACEKDLLIYFGI